MSKVKSFIIDHGVYNGETLYAIGHSVKQLRNLLRRKCKSTGLDPKEVEALFDDIPFDAGGFVYVFDTGHSLLWMKFYPEDTTDFGNLQHEIFHLAVNIMTTADIKFSEQTEEAFAYLIGWLTKQVYEQIL